MNHQEKDPAQLGTTPAGQVKNPIDEMTLGRLSRAQLQDYDLLCNGADGAIAQIPALAPFRELLQAASDALHDRHLKREYGPLADCIERKRRFNAAVDALTEAVSAAAQ